jgi:CRISPR-associated endonuclease/helicase Cas3
MLAGFRDRLEPVCIPEMNRELVEGGLHSQVLEGLAEELGADWQTDRDRLEGITGHRRQLARGHGIIWSQPYGPDSAGVMDDQRISTRLGLGDLQIELPGGAWGPFGREIHMIKVPAWMAGRVNEPLVEDLQPLPGGGFGFRMGNRQFIYDRLGLQGGEGK